MMISVREMQNKDLQQINLILSKSFTQARLKEDFDSGRVPLCRYSFLEMYLAASRDGAFVLQEENKIIAFCFTRLWGTIGWIGPLSVLPSEQGYGHGKKIVMTAIECLQKKGAKTIGLELSAESSKNLAFYTKLGFIPGKLTVDLVRKVASTERRNVPKEFVILNYNDATAIERKEIVEGSRSICSQLNPGLDYVEEIKLVKQYRFGDAILILNYDGPVGFILGHTEPYSEEEKRDFLKINALQLAANKPLALLGILLDVIENWAREEDLSRIYLRVPTRYHKGYAFVLSEDFKIVQNELRMTLDGYGQYDEPGQVNFSKWE